MAAEVRVIPVNNNANKRTHGVQRISMRYLIRAERYFGDGTLAFIGRRMLFTASPRPTPRAVEEIVDWVNE